MQISISKKGKEYVEYNGRNYYSHPLQKYFYVSNLRANYSKCLHRQIWFDNFGKIPDGYSIHHKNGDARDNRIENLELI